MEADSHSWLAGFTGPRTHRRKGKKLAERENSLGK